MAPDPISRLCAILCGRRDLPTGRAGESILESARRHRVDRLVAWRAKRIDDGLRVEIVLDELYVRELNRVLAALEDHGVFPIVFKGAAIAHTHYEASWLRPRVDADVLIPPGQRKRAFEVLHGLGYRRPPFTSGSLVAYQAPFVRTGRFGEDHALDVHWRVANVQAVAGLFTYDELALRACAVSVGGHTMRTPAAEDALLLACVHRVVHHDNADDLLWVYDIHRIAERFTPQQWQVLADAASNRGVKALCSAGLRLSSERFGTAIPAEIMSRLTSTGGARERAAVYLRKGLRPIDRLGIDLAVLGPRAGLRLVWEHLVPPASYVEGRYGVRCRTLLPAFYARRVVAGVSRWLARG
jgi:hypothetical protein